MDLAATKKEFGSKICLIGNIDLRTTLVSAPLEVVRQEVRQRFSEAGKGGGYICSSANSLAEYCRTENILAMRDEIGRCVY
jgi:uroporphyrinogen decarboxylase